MALIDPDSRFRASLRGVRRSAGSGEVLPAIGGAVGAPFEPLYQGLGVLAGTRIANTPEPYDLPRVKPTQQVRERLRTLYGDGGEHWDESLSNMMATPEGKDRFKLWASTIRNDSSYAARYAELKDRLGNSPEAFWTQVLGEYKEERKKDAEINSTGTAVRAAWDVASLLPAAKAAQVVKAAGGGTRLAVQAAVTNELMAIPELANTLVRGGGGALLRRPRTLALPLAGAAAGGLATGDLEGAVKGGLVGAGVGLLSGAGQMARYARGGGAPFTGLLDRAAKGGDDLLEWMTRTEKNVPDGALRLEHLGWGSDKLRPNALNLMEATDGAIPGNLGLPPGFVTGTMGAAYGGMQGGPLGMLIGGLTGAAASKLVPKAPGLTLGAIGGAALGASMNEDDPLMGALMMGPVGAVAGVGLQRGLRAATSPYALFEGGDVVNGDLKGWATFIGHLVPEQDLRRIGRFATQLYPALDEADRGFDLATAKMRSDFVDAVGGEAVLQDVKKIKRLTYLSQRMGRDPEEVKKGIDTGIRVFEPITDATPEELGRAYKMRQVIDRWFDDAVREGRMKPDQYLAGYVPRVLDEQKLWKQLPKELSSRGDVRALDRGIRNLLPKIDRQSTMQWADTPRDFFLEKPGEFFAKLDAGELSMSRDRAVKLLGGEARMNQLRILVEKADGYQVRPSTLMRILRGPPLPDDAGVYVGGRIRMDWVPQELLDESLLARTGADLPVIEHMPTVIDRYIQRTQRRRYYEPLVRAWNSVDEEPVSRAEALKKWTNLPDKPDTWYTHRHVTMGPKSIIQEERSNIVGKIGGYDVAMRPGVGSISDWGKGVKPQGGTLLLLDGEFESFGRKVGNVVGKLTVNKNGVEHLILSPQLRGKGLSQQLLQAGADLGWDVRRASDMTRAGAAAMHKFTGGRGPVMQELNDPRLQELHRGLARDNAQNLSKIARKIINSRLGVPSRWDVLAEDLLAGLMNTNPAKVRAAARVWLDYKYSGALGFNPGAATRGLFQGVLGATSLGPKEYALAMREVARRPEAYETAARKYGALRDPLQEAFDVARVAGDTPFKRAWNFYVDSSFEMFQAADKRVRLWAFAGGYRRGAKMQAAIAEAGPSHESLAVFRPDTRERLVSLAKTAGQEDFAGRFGQEMSDLTNWIYGNRGSPLAARGLVGSNVAMFKTWPANYLSLLYQWGSDGQIQRLLNMSIGAAILERIANAGGVGRLTGLSAPLPGAGALLPTGPFPQEPRDLLPPEAMMAVEAPRTMSKLAQGLANFEAPDTGVYENSATLMGARPLVRLGTAMTTDDPERAIRAGWGLSRPPGDR